MRIAIVAEVYLPKIDGVVIRTLNLIRQLQAAGDEVVVICPEANGPRNSPVPVVEFPGFAFPMYPEYRIGRPDHRLIEQVREFRPDIVHFLNPFAFGFQCYDLMASNGVVVPTVFSFHTLYAEFVKQYGALRPLSSLLWWLTKRYHNRANINLTVSDITRLNLSERGFSRVRLWQPAVDSQLFCPEQTSADMRSRLKRGHERKHLLLTVSRLAPEKNVEFLREVLEKTPEAQLAIVGDGPHRSSLEKHFEGLPVTFTGYLKGRELAEAYASCDAFVYASETETMGNVILEAMASGAPVIAPRAGGIPSLATHSLTGMLFEPGDAKSAAKYTHDLLTNDGFRKELTNNARRFSQEHNWKHAADRIRKDYADAIEMCRDQGTLKSAKARLSDTGLFARTVTKTLTSLFRIASALSRSDAVGRSDESPTTAYTQQDDKENLNVSQDAMTDSSNQGVDQPQSSKAETLARFS